MDSVQSKTAYNITIRLLESEDITGIVSLFHSIGSYGKTTSIYERYLSEQDKGERMVLVAYSGKDFVGQVTIIWHPDYPPFAEKNTPEISDLSVLPEFRRCGIGSILMDEAEKRIFERSDVIGIGFGISTDYGAAQRMFVKRGYIPDGQGLFAKGQYIRERSTVQVDDCAFYLTKKREH
jgi:GNAT superfamily N-acetyltransferase